MKLKCIALLGMSMVFGMSFNMSFGMYEEQQKISEYETHYDRIVQLPNEIALQALFDELVLTDFAKKTGIIKDLADKEKSVLGVKNIFYQALFIYQKKTQDSLSLTRDNVNRLIELLIAKYAQGVASTAESDEEEAFERARGYISRRSPFRVALVERAVYCQKMSRVCLWVGSSLVLMVALKMGWQ